MPYGNCRRRGVLVRLTGVPLAPMAQVYPLDGCRKLVGQPRDGPELQASERDRRARERRLAHEENKLLRRRRDKLISGISSHAQRYGAGQSEEIGGAFVATNYFGRPIEEADERDWWSHRPALAAEEERQRQLENQARARLSLCADGGADADEMMLRVVRNFAPHQRDAVRAVLAG
eukprot:SAG31_NODE_762_length_12275_cov_14.077119_12_plen_175_part_01